MTPTVSVVIPAYNQAEFLQATLDSVQRQTLDEPIEVIVVDDGSPDDSAAVARRHPLGPVVVEQANQGVAAARNAGIAAAQGEWIAFLDADDIWRAEKLSAQLTEARKLNRPALSFTRYERKRTDGQPVAEPLHPALDLRASPRQLVRGNFIGCSTVLVHRDVLARVGGFPTGDALQRGGQDYALWLRVAALFPLVYVPQVLVDYTVHANNRVGADPIRHYEAGVRALRSFYEWDPDRFRALTRMEWRAFVGLRSAKLMTDLATRRHHRSPELFRRALRATARSFTDQAPAR